MGYLRFHRSLGLGPGVRLNLSRSGLSMSVGSPGATLNLRQGEARVTSGLPGTGLSYVERHRLRKAQAPESNVSRQITKSMVAYARSVDDAELRHNLKEALITANAAKEHVAHLGSADRDTALWEVNIFRAELERRKADPGIVPETYDDQEQDAAYQRAKALDDQERAAPNSVTVRPRHLLLMTIVFSLIAGIRRGMRR